MNLPALLGRRDFFSKEEIIQFTKNSKNYEPEIENPRKADALVIFHNSNQKTWIVTTTERLYCILDDIRKEEPNINWSIPKKKIVSGNEVVLDIKPKEKSETTGLLDFGTSHTNWLFSRELFEVKSVDKSVRELIVKNML